MGQAGSRWLEPKGPGRAVPHPYDIPNIEVLAAERQVWNLTLGYAGTFDLLVRLRDGTLWLVDIKTGKASYPEHALQLIAYSMAEFVGEDDTVDEKTTTPAVARVSPATIRRWCRLRFLMAFQVGPGAAIRIPAAELRALLQRLEDESG